MFLEKIKEHSGKIMFFVMNILVVAVGIMFIRQKNTEQMNSSLSEVDARNYKETADYALKAQQDIEAKMKEKVSSSSNESSVATTAQSNEISAVVAPVQDPVVSTQAPVPVPVVVAPVKINGKCGSADSSADRKNSKCNGKAPSAGLCSTGIASPITFKPNKYDQGWNWKCEGKNGGTSVTCRCS